MIKSSLACAIPLLTLFSSIASADGPPGALKQCMDQLTLGIRYNSDGSTFSDPNNQYYPRFPGSAALPVCAVDPSKISSAQRCLYQGSSQVALNSDGSHFANGSGSLYPHHDATAVGQLCGMNPDSSAWTPVLQCMDELTAGTAFNSDGSRFNLGSGPAYPRYPEDVANLTCRVPGVDKRQAADCLNELSAGIKVNPGGSNSRWVDHATSSHPLVLVPASAAARVCGRNPSADGKACLSSLISASIEPNAAGALCGRNSTSDALQCMLRFKIQGMGLVSDGTAALICSQAPQTQPADASRIAACLNPIAVGQQGSTGTGLRADGTLLDEFAPAPVPAIPAAGGASAPAVRH